jgi:hypothetical protein
MTMARALDLISLPVRVAAAVGVSWLAVKTPYVAAILLALLLCVGLVSAVAWLVMRRAVRARSRVSCASCGHRMLEAAHICPKCHAPASRATERPA